MRKTLKIFGLLILLLALAFGAFVAYMTATQYQPAPVEQLKISVAGKGKTLQLHTPIVISSFNIGYAGLDSSQDFFMDGGVGVRPESAQRVRANLNGIISAIKTLASDINLLQEVDINSKRSYHLDEHAALNQALGGYASFAANFKSPYVPIPVLEPIGSVWSGVYSQSKFALLDSERIALPVPFKWPVSVFNLKRALLLSRIAIAGSEQQLVIVNLHLEAYDKSGGRLRQAQAMLEVLKREYAKGNFVIAGGDWNQLLPLPTQNPYKQIDSKIWHPPYIDRASLDIQAGWQLVSDTSKPTSRVNNQPFVRTSPKTQLHIIDGFLLSPNVQLNYVKTTDLNFEFSDHNPVSIEVVLKPLE